MSHCACKYTSRALDRLAASPAAPTTPSHPSSQSTFEILHRELLLLLLVPALPPALNPSLLLSGSTYRHTAHRQCQRQPQQHQY